MKQILIVIINYLCEQEIISFAKMIEKQAIHDKISLYVVDNKTSENCDGYIENELKSLKIDSNYLLPKENLGYFNGAIYAVKNFQETNGYIPEWVNVSNTDIKIEDNDFYKRFLSQNYADDIWCVAPSVVNLEGIYCNPHYLNRIPLSKVNRVIRIFGCNALASIYRQLSEFKRKHVKSRGKKPKSSFVYSSHGCFFILRDRFFDSVGDEGYGGFLYSEESYVAEIIFLNEKKSYYDDSLEVIHCENISTSKLNMGYKNKLISDSMKYIRDKFYK